MSLFWPNFLMPRTEKKTLGATSLISHVSAHDVYDKYIFF